MSNAQTSLQSIAGPAGLPSPVFSCSRSDAAWVHLAGELDIATAPQLEQTLRESEIQARLVVLDLRDLTFIDSCGVHAIVNASIRARQGGRRLALLRGPESVDRLFRLAGSSDDVEVGDVSSFAALFQGSV
jgi:anti-sigma B factor antagonist